MRDVCAEMDDENIVIDDLKKIKIGTKGTEDDGIEYWRKDISEFKQVSNIVLIHVCDENRQVTRDFCCKRDILVEHMKYFETFLAENDNGYEDIDISVHCDVEIFEWLMTYIHKPLEPPPLEKPLVVSILISSDFLHMEPLVELCLNQIAQNLNDIVKLPIDLSCISEKLLNRLALLTPSKLLSTTRDRKDKILNKLYKRRVELDFSRKSSGPKSLRSIATSLTCCKNCYQMYLDNYSSALVCRNAAAAVDFRGKLVRRHESVLDWSLTNYLKALHGTGGLSWEQIYWHVWSSCLVIRYDEIVFSLSEIQRYSLEADGIILSTKKLPSSSAAVTESLAAAASSSSADTQLQLQQQSLLFTLSNEDDFDRYSGENMTIFVSDFLSTDEQACDLNSLPLLSSSASLSGQTFPWGSGLNPFRKPQLLCRDIFEMLTSQMKLISFDSQQKILCESICKSTVLNTLSSKNLSSASSASSASASAYGGIDIRMDLWGALDGIPLQSSQGGSLLEEERNRGRSLSPRNRRSRSQGRQATSIGRKGRTNVDSNSPGPAEGTVMDANESNSNSAAVTAGGGVATNDRRSRSSGPQRSNQRGSSASSSSKLPPKIQMNGKQQSAAAAAVIPSSSSSLQSQSQCQASQPQRVPTLFSTLKCFPSEINRHVCGTRGPIHGIWITDHPLSSLPSAYYETVSVIDSFPSSLLTENKRAEWELDLMREYDAKRMDRLEEYLLSCRRNIEEQMKYASRRATGGGTGAGTAGGGGAKK